MYINIYVYVYLKVYIYIAAIMRYYNKELKRNI